MCHADSLKHIHPIALQMQLHGQWPSRRRRRDVDDEAALLLSDPPRVDAVTGLGAGGALAAADVARIDKSWRVGPDGWIYDARASFFPTFFHLHMQFTICSPQA